MKVQDWNRLQKNWMDLGQVRLDHVIPYLYQVGVLDSPSEKKFEDIYELLESLKKSPNPNCFQYFLDALEKKGYEALAKKIKSTKSSADPGLKPRGDPALLEPKAREILLREFVEKADDEVPLREIRKELDNNGLFKEITWSNAKIKEFLTTVFNGIEIPPPLRRRCGSKEPKMVYPLIMLSRWK